VRTTAYGQRISSVFSSALQANINIRGGAEMTSTDLLMTEKKMLIFIILLFFFQALNFLVESFGLLNEFFPFLLIVDAGYPVFGLHLSNVLFYVILLSVLGSSL
jgi:hypothetical protein